MGLPPPKMGSKDLVADAQQLIKKKDDIEAQLRELEDSLTMQGVGMDQPLVDAGGFPRSDIDVVAARTSRNLIHRLRNDHKDIMKEIEQALHAIHQASRQEKEMTGTASSSSSSPISTQQVSSTQPQQRVPFARVNAVAPDSPAYEAGLRREDKLVQFGSIHADNHDRLQALNQLVGRSEGIPITVIILRQENQQSLTLTPRQGWGGRGTLGCHIMTHFLAIGLITFLSATGVFAAGDQDVFEWQPEIHHAFRPAESMPPAWFSQLFSLIALSPWIVLMIGWLGLGVTPVKVLGQLTSGSSTMRPVSIIAFLASLASIEYLFYLYWTRLNIFETLSYLVILLAITFVTGQRALSQIQIHRKSSS
ncbi:hypothetical protein K492DRAFT_210615 [Lichtheimia hyalospora FSU 10163]|nr:hypothetical protein K492DRAFT_210615 [Lichtheimia hyalospora FSU 10163]